MPLAVQGFARPYDLELARHDAGDGFWATLRHVTRAGAVIRLEPGERLYVKPRQVRIFVEPAEAQLVGAR